MARNHRDGHQVGANDGGRSDLPALATGVLPAMQAVEAGYNVYGVVDASGGIDETVRELSIARMLHHGVTPINWTTVGFELQRDWRLPTAQDFGPVVRDHYHSYGLLMDSFESVAANVVKNAS